MAKTRPSKKKATPSSPPIKVVAKTRQTKKHASSPPIKLVERTRPTNKNATTSSPPLQLVARTRPTNKNATPSSPPLQLVGTIHPAVGADITIDSGSEDSGCEDSVSETSETASSISLTFDKDEVIEDQKKEIEDLKKKCVTLAQMVSVKTGEEVYTIQQVLDENSHMKLLLKSKDLTIAYWSEFNSTVNSFTSKKGRLQSIQKERKEDKRSLREVMQTHIFPYMKFCPKKLMHSMNDDSIALTVMKKLRIPEEQWAPWWAKNQELAEDLMVEHRTSSAQNMKYSFNQGMSNVFNIYAFQFKLQTSNNLHRTLAFLLHNKEKAVESLEPDVSSPAQTTKDIKNCMINFMDTLLQKDKFERDVFYSSQEAYCAFVNIFVKKIVPSGTFKEMITRNHSNFQETITPHDEGLGLSILDNNFKKWKAEAIKKLSISTADGQPQPADLKNIVLTKDDQNALPKAKYTMGSSGTSNIRAGWNREGVMDHVKHVKMIQTFRATKEFKTYHAFAAECILNKNSRKRKRQCLSNDTESISSKEAAKQYAEMTDEFFSITKFKV